MSSGLRSGVAGSVSVRHTLGSRRLALGLALAGVILAAGGCNDDDDCVCCPEDHEPPAAPRGLYSITGDDQVTLVWLASTESDLAGYRIYWSDRYDGTYSLIAEVSRCADCYAEEFVDSEAVNGATYFYAVSAFDGAGNEGDLSAEYVWDTPRPDGHAVVANAQREGGPDFAAFDFETRTVVAIDHPAADFFYTFDPFVGGFLVAGSTFAGPQEETAIQDMGYTLDFDEIDVAPYDDQVANPGWSPTGTAEPIVGHTYVLLTPANHYAKIRVTALTPEQMSFDWACQFDEGNIQLAHPVASERPAGGR
jgi:hypothetical protein